MEYRNNIRAEVASPVLVSVKDARTRLCHGVQEITEARAAK